MTTPIAKTLSTIRRQMKNPVGRASIRASAAPARARMTTPINRISGVTPALTPRPIAPMSPEWTSVAGRDGSDCMGTPPFHWNASARSRRSLGGALVRAQRGVEEVYDTLDVLVAECMEGLGVSGAWHEPLLDMRVWSGYGRSVQLAHVGRWNKGVRRAVNQQNRTWGDTRDHVH